jgi:cytochrome c|tara:strand:+ start:342 stop:866 length:525 start_codon:yes stop_codon:yes gene_type:complete
MGFEINKLVVAVLVTVLLIFGISKISDIIFKVNESGIVAYKVEVPTGTESGTKAESDVDLSSFLALGDIVYGEKIFKKCAACHSINKDGKNKIGVKLYNVVGRVSGAISDYKYSNALISYNKTWTFEELNGFLIKPAAWIKGNKMGFAGLKNDKDRASVILYLNQNSDNPQPLP